eukprot:CAMPEP_0184673064 /NCGR_PEP_ID=MMETSP0308-20130426/86468_1 /TAXON_ID=38269 /ORGANISM="Gloeochaete witrockiana, Strain SAG 46.84" /LENGTH=235 /DNA_ID=CAMNT_0027120505 /DNA_START=2586 /DNA_END=3293 /DNA_ORIENTATION=-
MIDTTAPEAEMQPACTEAETQPVDSSEVPHFSEEVFADVFAAFYRNPPTWDFEAVGRFKITDSTKVKDMRLLILESFKSLSRHDEYNDFVFLKVVGTSPQLKLSTFNSNDDTSLRDILSSWGDLYVSPRRRLPNSAISTLPTTQDTSIPPTIRSSWLGWLGGGFTVHTISSDSQKPIDITFAGEFDHEHISSCCAHSCKSRNDSSMGHFRHDFVSVVGGTSQTEVRYRKRTKFSD